MRRTGIRSFLAIAAFVYVAGTVSLAYLGRPDDALDTECRNTALVESAFSLDDRDKAKELIVAELTDADEEEAAAAAEAPVPPPAIELQLTVRDVDDPAGVVDQLIESLQAAVASSSTEDGADEPDADDDADSTAGDTTDGSSPAAAEPSTECLEAALHALNQNNLSDRVLDGLGVAAAALPFADDLPDDRSALPDPVETAVRFLLWFIPVTLVVLAARELVITRQLRRPGPVEVTAVTIDGTESSTSQAELRRALKQINLDPSKQTPGGIGEIVLPVADAASTGTGIVATIAGFVKGVIPKSGFEVALALTKGEANHSGFVTVQTKRDSQVLSVTAVSGESTGAAVTRAASAVFFAIHRFEPIRERTPSWSLWNNGDRLAEFVTRSAKRPPNEFASLLRDEPGNLAVRMAYARSMLLEAEKLRVAHLDAQGAQEKVESDENASSEEKQAAAKKVDEADQAAAGAAWGAVTAAVHAVRRAPRLVEPRAHLAAALAFAPRDTSPTPDSAAERARAALTTLDDEHPDAMRAATHRTSLAKGDHEPLTRAVVKSAIEDLGWWATITRYENPRLRRSININSLMPGSAARRSSVLLMQSIDVYASVAIEVRGKRTAANRISNTADHAATHAKLDEIVEQLSGLPEARRSAATAYNVLLCRAYLEPREGQTVEPGLERYLLDAAKPIRGTQVADLLSDADLYFHKAEINRWLERAGLTPADAASDTDWKALAEQRVAVWREHLGHLLTNRYQPNRFAELIKLEELLTADIKTLSSNDAPDESTGSTPPNKPDTELADVKQAIIESEQLVSPRQLEEITRERLRAWSDFVSSLASPAPPNPPTPPAQPEAPPPAEPAPSEPSTTA